MKTVHQHAAMRSSAYASDAAKICGIAGVCLMIFTSSSNALELKALDRCVPSAPLPPLRPAEFTPRVDDASASVPLPPRREIDEASVTADVPLPPRRDVADSSATANKPAIVTEDIAAAVAADVPLPPRRDIAGSSATEDAALTKEDVAPTDNLMAEAVPMPPPRPEEFQSQELSSAEQSSPTASTTQETKSQGTDGKKPDESKPVTPLPPQPPAASAEDNDDLRARILANGKLVAESLPPLAAPGACGITSPIKLSAINVGGEKVTISPPVVMRASLADAVADWVRDDLAPAFATHGDRLIKIDGAGAYQCRNRDHLAHAKLSEHARGNAMDITAFVTAKGKHLELAGITGGDVADMPSLAPLMKETACRRFMTVLGPGGDPFHAEHLHVDLEPRRSGKHLCQWAVPQVAAELRR